MFSPSDQLRYFKTHVINAITVDTIAAEYLAYTTDELEGDRQRCVAELARLGFDDCGVRRVGGPLLGTMRRDHLEGASTAPAVAPFDMCQVVGAGVPLVEVLSLLLAHRRLFVVRQVGVSHIVTLADLHKQPARLLLFGLISTIEMYVTELLGTLGIDDAALDGLITEGRVRSARREFDKRRNANSEINFVECLQLCDKIDVVARFEAGRLIFGGVSNSRIQEMKQAIESMRNGLAHANSRFDSGDLRHGVAITLDVFLHVSAQIEAQ